MRFMSPLKEVLAEIAEKYVQLEKEDQRLVDCLLNDVRFVVERLVEKDEVSYP